MCTNNWPLLLDLSRDECKRILRRLELEAYSAVLTAFRAQGDLSKDKKTILQELQNILSISTERHRAEVRRAVNDEKLTTIADNMAGPDVSSEWQIEGRRLIPLMPRLVPQTAFTVTANNAASMQAEKNLSLPPPSQTGSKEVVPTTPTTPISAAPATTPKAARPTSPASNVVVLPSGMSIHIKGGLNTDEEEMPNKKGRRSSSTEQAVITKTTHTPVPTIVTKPNMVSATPGTNTSVSPMKITFTKSPAKPQTTTATQSQKVILVSTTSHSGSSPAIIQKSMAVPVIKTTTTTGGTVTTFTSPRASIIMPSSMASNVSNGNLGSIVTVATTSSGGVRSSSAVTALTTANPTLLASSLNAMRPRTKMITTRPKVPMQMSPRAGMVMQMGGQHVGGSPMPHGQQGLHNIHVKPVHTKPTIHIKHEGGMKIITQGMPTSGSKILPKPPGSAQGSQMVGMSTSQPQITMVSKSNTSLAGQVAGGRVLNITTQGGKVIASSSNRGTAANVVTVNPKTLQLTAIKGAGGTTVLTTSGRVATATGAKPNVIVVQKAQPKRGTPVSTTTVTYPRPSSSGTSSTYEKKQDLVRNIPTQKTVVTKQTITKPGLEAQIKRQPQPYPVKVRGDSTAGEGGRSSLLAELIQAVGIQPDSSGDVSTTSSTAATGGSSVDNDPTSGVHTVVVQQEEVVMTSNQQVVTVPTPTTSKVLGGNRWVEYDVPRGSQTLLAAGRDSSDTSAIKALLDLQTGAKQPRPRGVSIDTTHGRLTHDRFSIVQHGSQTAQPASTISRQAHVVHTSRPQQHGEGLTTNVVLEQPDGETVAVQLSGADLSQLTSMGQQEIIGELDPETGIFYTTAPGGGETPITVVSTAQMATQQILQQPTASMKGTPVTTSTAPKPIDFLSSALTQAQIDLDPYQFIDEDEPGFGSKVPAGATESSTDPTMQQATDGSLMQILTPDSSVAATQAANVQSHVSFGSTQEMNLDLATDSLTTTIEASPSTETESLVTPSASDEQRQQHQGSSSATSLAASSTTQMKTPLVRTVVTTVHVTRPNVTMVQTSQPVMSTGQATRPTITSVLPPAVVSTPQIVSSTIRTPSQVSVLGATQPVVVSTPQTSSATHQIATQHTSHAVVSTVPAGLQSMVATSSSVQQILQSEVTVAQTSQTAISTVESSTPTVSASVVDITAIETTPVNAPTVQTAVPSVQQLVPSDEVTSSTSEGAPVARPAILEAQGGEILEEMVVSDGIIDFAQHEVCVPDTASNVTVAVEPGGLDTTTMVIEDFTSQQYITDPTDTAQHSAQSTDLISVEYAGQGTPHMGDMPTSPTPGSSLSESGLSSGEYGDSGMGSPVRASQRKRRPPSMPDDSPPHSHGNMASWVRLASSLLQKVCKYRGSRKEKGELNASAWFLAPVDPKEVPDYYSIIKKPMDFGTIRHKLETSQYTCWDDFHGDMLLVQENCRRYNPPEHEIRRDCDEVFHFYMYEYEMNKDKWQRMHTPSSSKKSKLALSPVRT